MQKIEYPEIEFVETDTESIENNLIQIYEEMKQKSGNKNYKVYPASPEKLFISFMAAIIVQQRVLINQAAKMNVPRWATGEYLDSIAELFKDAQRLPASPARATFRCYISEEQQQSIIIPKGTRVTFDGDIVFATEYDLEIKKGELYADVEAVCETAGTIGNDLAPGQVKEIIDVYDYFQKIENITRTSGGTDQETDKDFRERMREDMEAYSTAGPANGYIYFAKSVSAAVSDVAVDSPEPGIVDVRILLKNGEKPTETILKNIEAELNAETIRPLTDIVKVSVPNTVEFDIDLTFWIDETNMANAKVIEEKARTAVNEFIAWQTEKMGRDINQSNLIARLMQTGVKRVAVRKPEFTVIDKVSVATLKNCTILNGGVESV